MQNFIDSINIVLPIFLLVVLGFILKKLDFASEKFYEDSEKFVFNIALPAQLFLSVAFGSSSGGDGYFKLILFSVVSVTAAFLLSLAVVPLLIKDNGVRGSVVQNCYRSNFAVLGIPLAANIAGDGGRMLISILMPFVIIMFNAYTVIEMNIFAPKEHRRSFGSVALATLRSVVTNPLIIAVVLGLPFLITGWRPSENFAFIEKTVEYISDTTQALVLISLGASFSFASLKGKIKYSLPCAIYKTALLPLIAVTVAHFVFGFVGAELAVILILFGSPSAVSSYVMAKKLKSDAEVAGQTLLLSTLFCSLTLFVGIFLLKTLGWI